MAGGGNVTLALEATPSELHPFFFGYFADLLYFGKMGRWAWLRGMFVFYGEENLPSRLA